MKFWIKWGVAWKNLTGGCQVMPQKPFWAHFPQIFVTWLSPHVRLKFQKKKKRSVGHKILNKMRSCLWKSGKWLPSYAQKIILDLFAPNLYTRAQVPWGSRFLVKKIPVLFMKFWTKWGFVCENLTGGCRVMSQKRFWAHFPQIHILGPSPHLIFKTKIM